MPRSALALAALATSAVPGLDAVATCAPQRVTADTQMTGLMDADGRGWTVRCPLHPAAAAQFEGELALLSTLARQVDEGALPFEVPRIAGLCELPEGGRLLVSPRLPGRPIDLDELRPGPGLAASLGAAIASLHDLSTDLVAEVGLPVYTADSYRRRCLAEVDEAARTGRVPSVLLNRWERALEDVSLWRFQTTPVHADLAPDQVLVADGHVTAFTSFAEAHVGDPAIDLAWLMASAPENALDSIVEAYVMGRPERADAALLDRAMLTSELALARWLLHGQRTQDENVIADATQMLDELATDVLNAPPIGYHEPVVVAASEFTGPPSYDPVTGQPLGGVTASLPFSDPHAEPSGGTPDEVLSGPSGDSSDEAEVERPVATEPPATATIPAIAEEYAYATDKQTTNAKPAGEPAAERTYPLTEELDIASLRETPDAQTPAS